MNESAFGVEHISKDFAMDHIGVYRPKALSQKDAKKKVRGSGAKNAAGAAGIGAGVGSALGRKGGRGKAALAGAGIAGGISAIDHFKNSKARQHGLTNPKPQPVVNGKKGPIAGPDFKPIPKGASYDSTLPQKNGKKGVSVVAKSAFGVEHE